MYDLIGHIREHIRRTHVRDRGSLGGTVSAVGSKTPSGGHACATCEDSDLDSRDIEVYPINVRQLPCPCNRHRVV